MPEDGTVDQCLKCQREIVFHFGVGWEHTRDGLYLCEWTEEYSLVATPTRYPSWPV